MFKSCNASSVLGYPRRLKSFNCYFYRTTTEWRRHLIVPFFTEGVLNDSY